MAKNARPVPGSRAEVLLDQLLEEVRGLRADMATDRDLDPHALGVIEATTPEAASG